MTDFSKFKTARMGGGGFRYPKAGDHIVKITSVKMGESRKNIEFFAVAATILHTTSEHADMVPGNTVDWSTHADKDPYEGNVKQFVGAVLGVNEAELDAMPTEEFSEIMESITGEVQYANDKVLKMVCVERTSKANNGYTAVRWEPVEGAEEAQPVPLSALPDDRPF